MTSIDLGRDTDPAAEHTQVELIPAHPGYDLLVAFGEESGTAFTRTTIVGWAVRRKETYDASRCVDPICLDTSIISIRIQNAIDKGRYYIEAISRPDGKIQILPNVVHEGRDDLIEYDEFVRFCEEICN